jgi:hypothetical protein
MPSTGLLVTSWKNSGNLGQAADADGDDHEEGQQANILLDCFMLHQ